MTASTGDSTPHPLKTAAAERKRDLAEQGDEWLHQLCRCGAERRAHMNGALDCRITNCAKFTAGSPGDSTPDLTALRKLADAATPGPWTVRVEGRGISGEYGWVEAPMPGAPHCFFGLTQMLDCIDDTRFIAAARTAVPALLDLVASQAAEIAQLRSPEGAMENAQRVVRELGLGVAVARDGILTRAEQVAQMDVYSEHGL